MEYRVVRGTSHEGLSIRSIYYDKLNNIVDWDDEPQSALTGNVQELVTYLIEAFKSVEDMVEATKKPIIDEGILEEKLEK